MKYQYSEVTYRSGINHCKTQRSANYCLLFNKKLFLVDPPDHVLHVLGVLPHDPVLLEERLKEGGAAPLLPDLRDLLQSPLAKPDL